MARYLGAEGRLPVCGAGRGHVVTTDGARLRATCVGLADGAPGVALAHPERVAVVAEGGIAAVRAGSVFEAGRWRTRWKVGGGGDELLGLHTAPPPEHARLSIDPAGLFAFPAGRCGEEDTTRWETRIAAGKQAGSAPLRSGPERARSLLHPLVKRWMPGTGH